MIGRIIDLYIDVLIIQVMQIWLNVLLEPSNVFFHIP